MDTLERTLSEEGGFVDLIARALMQCTKAQKIGLKIDFTHFHNVFSCQSIQGGVS